MSDHDEITLAEIGRKLDSALEAITRVVDDHEQRLRNIEKWVYAIPPTLLIAGGSIVAAIVT